MGNSINNQFKMRRHGGAVERATETSGTPYSEAQGRTMAQMGMVDNTAMNSGHIPTNYGTTPIKKTKIGEGQGVEIGEGAENKLDEVILTAKSPETIKKQVDQNIAGAHSSAGRYSSDLTSDERKKEIAQGKFTTGGKRSDITNTELKIYNKLKSKA